MSFKRLINPGQASVKISVGSVNSCFTVFIYKLALFWCFSLFFFFIIMNVYSFYYILYSAFCGSEFICRISYCDSASWASYIWEILTCQEQLSDLSIYL